MTDLPPSVWKEIEAAAYTVNGIHPQDGSSLAERAFSRRVIEIGALRTILRKARRTSSQNATLWMVYEQILKRGGEDLAGFTKEDLHEYFLIAHFGSETKELFGRKRLKPLKRSSRLSKSEFADFLDYIVRFAAERGIVVDMPGDVL